MPKISNLHDLLVNELRDLYNAEKQLLKALPKMAKASSNDELAQAFKDHLEQTRGHVERLEDAFGELEVSVKGKTCQAMTGLVEEGSEMISEDAPGEVKDAGLIGAAQRVEHYEIAAYGTAVAFAETLGLSRVAEILGETLEEEKQADELLNEIAERINPAAAQGEEDDEEGDEDGDNDEELTSSSRNGGRRRRK